MDDSKDVIRDIASVLYDLFVVNRNAIAVQRSDGNYTTKYLHVSSNDVFNMLIEKKAIGTYQQLYKCPYLKWICFDFDCKDKENPDLTKLYSLCTKPLNLFLEEQGISYVNEFSGRRGIHTWIIFEQYVSKQDAYEIIQTIKRNVNWDYDIDDFGLDEFPSTPYSKGNVVGKQVKIPLSTHKLGGMSYLFKGEYHHCNFVGDFYDNQLEILKSVKRNDLIEIKNKLMIKTYSIASQFTKTHIIGGIQYDAKKVIEVLSQTKVYKALLDRVLYGEAMLKDWLVMLGTLGNIDDNYGLLKGVFKLCPSYSENETNENIKKYGKKYYPATFEYLYSLYEMNLEPELDPKETGLEYLIRNLGIEVSILNEHQNEMELLEYSKYTVEKEKNYLFSNDEVPVVSIAQDLAHITVFDTQRIDKIVHEIKDGKEHHFSPKDYFVFKRIESDSRERDMVSLSAYDRTLTSHIALNVFYKFSKNMKSYSYNPNYISTDEMFYHWFASWGNYLSQIRKYIEIDLYSNMHVLTLDVKHFYDSIDFMGVYNAVYNSLTKEDNYLFLTLVNYNEKLMLEISNTRKGVPQGPAYARIIAEIFLGILVDKALDCLGKEKSCVTVYRYVDDIIIFYDSSINGNAIFDCFANVFGQHGLSLNMDKSKIYGEIRSLSDKQKAEIMRSDQFQYGLRISDYSYLTEDEYVTEKVHSIIQGKGGFNINDLSYFFSVYSEERAKRLIFSKYARQIMSCEGGRGSGFQLFYRYVFNTQDILEKCLTEGFFDLVPFDSINFSCLLAIMFYSFKENLISSSLKTEIIEKYIDHINVESIQKGEDKSIVLSLSKQEKC